MPRTPTSETRAGFLDFHLLFETLSLSRIRKASRLGSKKKERMFHDP